MRRFVPTILAAVILTSSPLPAADLKVTGQAIALEVLERGHAVARWYADVDAGDGPLRFGELVMTDDAGETDTDRPIVPLIGSMRGVNEVALKIADEDGRQLGWRFIARGPADRGAWGVLDSLYTDPNPSLTIVHTTDGGATWTTLLLKKPSPHAEFVSMALDEDGRGQLTTYLPTEKGGLQPGYYPFTTTDGGQTWTADKPNVTALYAREFDTGDLRSPVQPRKVRAEWYGGSGWIYCHRPICRPYGRTPQRPPGGWVGEAIEPSVHDKGRLQALENPGFDDRLEKGKVPARFDITPKQK